jgi:hypothetical protein
MNFLGLLTALYENKDDKGRSATIQPRTHLTVNAGLSKEATDAVYRFFPQEKVQLAVSRF